MTAIRHATAVFAFAASSIFGADAGLLALAPPDTKVVAGVYVDRTRNSPFGQFVLSQIKDENPDFNRFVAAAGFDPRRDVREVITFSDQTGGRGAKHSGLVAATGVFNGPQILAAIKAEGGGSITAYNGVDILSTKGGAEQGGVAFLNGSLALMGNLSLVKAAIDRGRSSPQLDATLSSKVSEVSGRFDAWFVATGFATPGAAAMPRGALPQRSVAANTLQGIQQTSGGVKFGSTVEFSGEAVARSEKDAQSLVDVGKFLSGMLTMKQNQDPQAARFVALLQNLSLTTQGNTVQVRLSVPETELEGLLESRKAPRRAAAR